MLLADGFVSLTCAVCVMIPVAGGDGGIDGGCTTGDYSTGMVVILEMWGLVLAMELSTGMAQLVVSARANRNMDSWKRIWRKTYIRPVGI